MMTPLTFRFMTHEYTVAFDEKSRITVTHRGKLVVDHAVALQAGKTMISAVYELEELKQKLVERMLALPDGSTINFGADELPTQVQIEDGKYTFGCAQSGSRHIMNAHIDRHNEAWIEADELEHKDFWITLAGALHNTRRRLAVLDA